MDKSGYALLMIAVIALVTALLRFLPFLIFNGRRPVPAVIRYLGAVLPYSVMSMLVVYCLKDVSFRWRSHCPAYMETQYAAEHHRRNSLLYGADTVSVNRQEPL